MGYTIVAKWWIVVNCGEKVFVGEFSYKIDEKGRVPFPPRFRTAFKDGLFLGPGLEKCVVARTSAEWKRFANEITGSSISPSKMRKLSRALFATAFETSLDGQGRAAVPAPLRDYAHITSDVVVAGANDSLEIWDRELWEEEKASARDQAWQIIESLEKRS